MPTRFAKPYVAAICAVLAASFGPLRPSAAHASDASEAEDLIRTAVRYRREGQDQKAFPLLQRAYELTRTPRTEAQLGLVEMALGYWLECEGHLTEALAAKDNPWIASNRKTLEATLRTVQDKNAELRVVGAPPGAAVSLNGKSVGHLPLEQPILVTRGRLELSVTSDGFTPRSVTVSVATRHPEPVEISLVREANSAIQPTLTDTAKISPGTQSRDVPERGAEGDGAGVRRGLVWAGAIGSGALLALGTTALVLREQKANDFNAGCGYRDGNVTDRSGGPAPQSCLDLKHQVDSRQTLAIVGLVGGGALAAASLVLWLTEPTPESRTTHALRCVPSTLGAVCGLHF